MSERVRPAKTEVAKIKSASWQALTSSHGLAPASPVARAGTSSGGQALDRHTSAEMSARFGHEFSRVRIHTDARAEESADALGAHAYASGNNIVFGGGKYTPGSPDTERLLAHELTHVAQQARFGPASDPSRLSRRGDAAEREADSLASQVLLGQNVQVQATPTAAIHRYQAPDQEWNEKLAADEQSASDRSKEANPLFGNTFSAFRAMTNLGKAGYDEITGNKEIAEARLVEAEDDGLNAIPFFGNRRAAKQAEHDKEVVAKDKAGADPAKNTNSGWAWADVGGGADTFNKSLKNIWDEF